MTKRPVNVEVVARKNESTDRLIRRFMKQTKDSNVLKIFCQTRFFERKKDKARRKRK